MENKENIKEGQHLWVKLNDQLVMVCMVQGLYYVCGPWECEVYIQEFEIISYIDFPEGYSVDDWYYKG